MSTAELLSYMMTQGEKVGAISNPNVAVRLPFSAGFAILIPKGTEQTAMEAVDRELISRRWSFERIKIRGEEYYVLFPFG